MKEVAFLFSFLFFGISLNAQTSPGIDSLLNAIKINKEECSGCGNLCRKRDWLLQMRLSKQYFTDGYPEIGLNMASKHVGVSTALNDTPFQEVFLDLLFQHYPPAILLALIEAPEFHFTYSEFDLMILNDTIEKEEFAKEIPLVQAYVKLGNFFLVIARNQYHIDRQKHTYFALETPGELKQLLEKEFMQVWKKSSLYQKMLLRINEEN